MNAFKSFVCASCRRSLTSTPLRTPTTTRSISSTPRNAADDTIENMLGKATNSLYPSPSISSLLERKRGPSSGPPAADYDSSSLLRTTPDIPHRIHVYATKHNTHITLTQPPKKDPNDASKMIDVLLSLSSGNLGFKKAGRGSYDAGYQLAAFLLKQIQERGLLREIHNIEVVLRGFGAGREAVSKALLGHEGRLIRNKIVSVKDATRLKFGGSRSPKPRRLG